MRHSLALFALLLAPAAFAADAPANGYVISLKDHRFSPASLTIPAGQKVQVTVKNEMASAAEFESDDFDREKVVAANDSINVFIGPLKAGTYHYFDDFHHESTGVIVAR